VQHNYRKANDKSAIIIILTITAPLHFFLCTVYYKNSR